MQRVVVVSGLSGSGKSVALNMLEDLGWFCIDNIPAGLLQALVAYTVGDDDRPYQRLAVGLDARNRPEDLQDIPQLITDLRRSGIRCEVIYLHAEDEALLRRFAETRRRHPLASDSVGLAKAIELESALLHPLADAADLVVDTTAMSVHRLREIVRQRVEDRRTAQLSVLFESFAYKTGIPGDADFVFDTRTLPNPYWEIALRPLTGRDPAVREYLEASTEVATLFGDIMRFVEARIPEYERHNRGYLTVAIGCTGGQHRSVFMAEKLAAHFASRHPKVLVRHSALPDA
jgi:UPF0042 nucleotide-binding protein